MWESFGADAPDVYDDWLLTDDTETFMVDSGAGEDDIYGSKSAVSTPLMAPRTQSMSASSKGGKSKGRGRRGHA